MGKIVHPRAASLLAATATAAAAATALLFLSSKSRAVHAFASTSTSTPAPASTSLTTARTHRLVPPAAPRPPLTSTSLFGERYNPLASLLGDAASSLFSNMGGGGGSGASTNFAEIDALVAAKMSSSSSSATARTWDDVRSSLVSKQTSDEERDFRANLAKGYGPPSPLHKVRLYDESNREEDVRVTLYRDSASWCPYCHKVWMTLEEKRIPYRVEKINMRCYGDKPASFTKLQPSGAIPVAIIDGTVYNQSNDIMYALEGLFPEHKRLGPDDDDRMKAQSLLKLERKLFSAWMYWLTGGDTPDGRMRKGFIAVLKEVDDELSASRGGDFFLGERVTLVDAMFAPFLERMAASLLFFKGFEFRVAPGKNTDFPAVNRWFDAMETLDSYRLTKSDYYTHCWDLPPQLGGCSFESASKPYEDAINGLKNINGVGGSWDLPLQPHNGGAEPDWSWCDDDDGSAKREAAERVSSNRDAVAKFAARGAGTKGFPPAGAPLADPNAVPDGGVVATVDAVLRITCAALLDGTDDATVDSTMSDVAALLASDDGGGNAAEKTVASLAYLRDRVGVPRDMRLPAARQLRAHLNWAIGKILDAQQQGS